jgi:hypothetical protein
MPWRNSCIGRLLCRKEPLNHKWAQMDADWQPQTRHPTLFMGAHLACPKTVRPSSGTSPSADILCPRPDVRNSGLFPFLHLRRLQNEFQSVHLHLPAGA